MDISFANSGKRINYRGQEFKIIESGVTNDVPYVHLEPENKKLAYLMIDEIRDRGNLTARIGGVHRLVPGEGEYPYW